MRGKTKEFVVRLDVSRTLANNSAYIWCQDNLSNKHWYFEVNHSTDDGPRVFIFSFADAAVAVQFKMLFG